jgi:hypothetical protein
MTEQQLLEEMLEFGLRHEIAQNLAPILLTLENDSRGFAQALIERAPRIAEHLGLLRRH